VDDLVHAVRDLVDLLVVHRHPVEHQRPVDADHVPVPAAELPQQVQHGLAERQLTGPALAEEEGRRWLEREDLVRQRAGELPGRPGDPVLHRPVDHGAAGPAGLLDDGDGDVRALAVVDDRHPIPGADVEAGAHGVPGAGSVLRQHDARV
jgi:hypothetical protein